MKHRKDQVYHVEFKNGNPAKLYKKLKSIYDFHTLEEIGCKVEWLWQKKITTQTPFENKKVKILLIEIRK